MFILFKNLSLKIISLTILLDLLQETLSLSESTTCSPGFYFDTSLVDCAACPTNSEADSTGNH